MLFTENSTARDILAHAIEQDSAVFRAALIRQAEIHDDAAALSRYPAAKRGAIASKNACLTAYDIIGRDESASDRALFLSTELGPAVVALNVACKLLEIPSHIRTSAAVTLDKN